MTRPPESWIGRRWRHGGTITERHVEQFRMTLDGSLAESEVPPGFHWTMILDTAAADALGDDGHPRAGLFMPDLGLPRRMWAGGSLLPGAPLRCGDRLVRDSVIADIAFKDGASGRLGFVTVDHVWSVGGKTRIRERQDIVYRGPDTPGRRAAPAPAWPGADAWTVRPDPLLVFRYSAVTFNSHRIHWDLAWARDVEHYDGLVVHGPLQVTWMLNLATSVLGRQPSALRYRSVSPLVAGDEAAVEARGADGGLELRVRRLRDGGVTTTGRADP